MSDSPVVHFEMPYEDAERVKKFYSEVFGWDMMSYGEDMGSYVLATTTEVDEATGRPSEPGGINGGFYPLKDSPEHKEPSFVIAVDDLDKAVEDIKAAGGTILREPEEIPGIGMWASFRDSEGNRVSVMKPIPPQTKATNE